MGTEYRLARAKINRFEVGQAMGLNTPPKHKIVQVILIDKDEEGNHEVFILYEVEPLIVKNMRSLTQK